MKTKKQKTKQKASKMNKMTRRKEGEAIERLQALLGGPFTSLVRSGTKLMSIEWPAPGWSVPMRRKGHGSGQRRDNWERH